MPYCFSRSSAKFQGHTAKKIVDFDPNWAFRTVTPIRIHWWLWNDAQSLKQHRCPIVFQGHPSNFKVTQDKKLTILTQIERFRTVTWVLIYQWLSNDAQSSKQHKIGALLFFKIILQISRPHKTKNINFDPNWAFPHCNSSLNCPIAMKWCTKPEVA